MAKRAIYFDERERDLMRKILIFVDGRLDKRLKGAPYPTEVFAMKWTRQEVDLMFEKFEEREDG